MRLQGNGRWRHNHFPTALNAARACADDLASVVLRDNGALAFRTGVSCDCRSKIILWADIGTNHVMKHWNDFQPFGATSGANRFIALNLHVALWTRYAGNSIESKEPNKHVGDLCGNSGVVQVNGDGRVQRRWRCVGAEADTRNLGCSAVAHEELRRCICLRKG